MEIDYVSRAKNAIIEDAKIVLSLPDKILSEATRKKYGSLNFFVQGISTGQDIIRAFYDWTIIEEMDFNPNSPLFFPSPENLAQIVRAQHIDAILRTTKGDLGAALEQARTELTTLLKAVQM